MHGSYCYLPILRAKAGEFSAVATLSPRARSRITPLFDVPVQGIADEQRLDAYLRKRAEGILNAWGTDRPVYVDVHDLPHETGSSSDGPPIARLLGLLRMRGARAIPVTGTIADRGETYLADVRAIAELDRRGACLRLAEDDLAEPHLLGSVIGDVLQSLGIAPSQLDVVLDLRYVGRSDLATVRATALEAVRAIHQVGEFRNLVLAGGSVPQMLGRADESAERRESRFELALWREIISMLGEQIPIAFGDHGIVWAYFAPPAERVRVPARIRYTTDRDHVFYRATRGEYARICRQLVSSDDFLGANYSIGDKAISLRAQQIMRPGGPASWIAADTNHHLELVSAQAWALLHRFRLLDQFSIPEAEARPWLQPELI